MPTFSEDWREGDGGTSLGRALEEEEEVEGEDECVLGGDDGEKDDM